MLLTSDELKKAEKYIKYAELRLAEAREMAKKGKADVVEDLAKEYEENIKKSNEIIEKARNSGKDVTDVAELVAIATAVHLDVLDGVREIVPEQAKPAIERAKEASMSGNRVALSALESVVPEKASEIHLRIAEKVLLKAREKAKKGEDISDLVEEYEKRINKSKEIAKAARELGRDTTAIEQLIEEATSTHLQVLAGIYEIVPDEAKPAIEKAISVSTKGEEETSSGVEKILEEEEEKVPVEKEVPAQESITQESIPEKPQIPAPAR